MKLSYYIGFVIVTIFAYWMFEYIISSSFTQILTDQVNYHETKIKNFFNIYFWGRFFALILFIGIVFWIDEKIKNDNYAIEENLERTDFNERLFKEVKYLFNFTPDYYNINSYLCLPNLLLKPLKYIFLSFIILTVYLFIYRGYTILQTFDNLIFNSFFYFFIIEYLILLYNIHRDHYKYFVILKPNVEIIESYKDNFLYSQPITYNSTTKKVEIKNNDVTFYYTSKYEKLKVKEIKGIKKGKLYSKNEDDYFDGNYHLKRDLKKLGVEIIEIS